MDKKYLTYDEIVAVECGVDEQETNVAWYRGENIIRWFTSDNTMVTEFKWKVKEAPDTYKMYVSSYNSNGKPMGYFIEMPLDLLSFRKKHRESTESQKQGARERLKRMHEKRKLNKKQIDICQNIE